MRRFIELTPAAAVAALVFLNACFTPADPPAVAVHYVGHASFLLTFPTGLTVLTDYGESRAYGLDSPVYGLGAAVPDVVTLSHEHADHAGGQLPEGVGTILQSGDSLDENGVQITSIPTYEGTLDAPDNASFLFEYAGLKILHLGDCQALILRAAEPEVRDRIRSLYPDTYDLVFLPIGYVHQILDEAAEFITLIDARRVIPMHYWSPTDRDAFLERMTGRFDSLDRAYQVTPFPEPNLVVKIGGTAEGPPQVLGLTPAAVTAPSEQQRP